MKVRLPVLLAVITIVTVFSFSNKNRDRLPATSPSGKADFSRYVSIGNSLTAGSADKGLYLEGQQNAYPEILAAQMKSAGGGHFSSPFFSAEQENGSGYLSLGDSQPDGTHKLEKITTHLAIRGQVEGPGGYKVNLLTKYHGPIENYGVPHIRLSDITSLEYGNVNEFFERLLPEDSPGNKISYLDFVTEKPFTFFTCWLGSNDILQYAAKSGAPKVSFPTDQVTFDSLYHMLAERLTVNGAKGVLATIPDVTKSALFTTVTYASLLKQLQRSASPVKKLFIQTGQMSTRAATADDLFNLTLGVVNIMGQPDSQGHPYGTHPENPIENKFVLDKAEIMVVKNFTDAYNSTIRAVAKSKDLALYDAYGDLNDIASPGGITENGIRFTNTFITGDFFSLDGLHLTPKGYAHVANKIIKAINAKYHSNIPLADVSKFRGVKRH